MAVSNSPEVADVRLHLNLIEGSRQFFALDPNAEVAQGDGWFFGAGSNSHPTISNAAFRGDERLDPEEFVQRAQEFFAARGRGFSVWVRGDVEEDRDLAAAAEAAGMQLAYAMPEMVLPAPVPAPTLPAGAELRRLTDPEQAVDFWQIAKQSYASLGFPPEVFAGYTNHDGLFASHVAAFIVYFEGEPASIAMTIVSHGVAGIYWVGSLERARGKGLGRAATTAATNAGFELGGEIASLQASPMGKPIYEDMGFETLHDYRLLMRSAP